MNAKIFGRINHFLKSEEGRVGLKIPMVLGIGSGSLLLAQSVLSASAYPEGHECETDLDCDPGESCIPVCHGTMVGSICLGTFVNECREL